MTVIKHRFQRLETARETCGGLHDAETLSYNECMCSGIDAQKMPKAKHYYCKLVNDQTAKANSDFMGKLGIILGCTMAAVVLLVLIVLVIKTFKKQFHQLLASCGYRKQMHSCSRMFCCCCSADKDDPGTAGAVRNENLSHTPTSLCGRFFYSASFLALTEFFCDCDCFRGRSNPKPMSLYGGATVERPADGREDTSSGADETVTLQPQLRRMRSVRKAPPPPVGVLPHRTPTGSTSSLEAGTSQLPAGPAAAAAHSYISQLPQAPTGAVADPHGFRRPRQPPPSVPPATGGGTTAAAVHGHRLQGGGAHGRGHREPPAPGGQLHNQLAQSILLRRTPSESDL